jgi:MFS family permease
MASPRSPGPPRVGRPRDGGDDGRTDEREATAVPTVEDCEDAVLDGDRPYTPGSARAAFGYPVFRRMFVGAFLSQIGTWMQNVVLGALAYSLTGSPTFVGIMIFAQLGPFLLLSVVGGVLADRFDRRILLIIVSASQASLALLLAAVVLPDDPNLTLLVAVVFAIGVGQAIFGPTYSALLPQLVDRRDLAGAVSLNSAQLNAARVIGPPIGAFLDSSFDAPAVFVANAVTYGFVIAALLSVRLPAPSHDAHASKGLRVLGDGFRIARRRPLVGRCLTIMFTYSLISLPFIGQLPVVAERNLGIDERSPAYGWLYACFGVGAMTGALAIGTIFSRQNKSHLARMSVAAFAVALAAFAVMRSPAPAYPTIILVGFTYFAMVTSLMTIVQQQVADNERGRVMALWLMCFAGTVPLANLIAGPLIELTSMTTVMLGGAAWAAILTFYTRVDQASVAEA